MKSKVIFIIIFILILLPNLYAQYTKINYPSNVKCEGNYFYKGTNLYSDVLVIKFKKLIFDLPKGIVNAQPDIINEKYNKLKERIRNVEKQYGKLTFNKIVPSAVWGDTLKTNVLTKEIVKVHDYSQLFKIKFQQPYLIDSLKILFKDVEEIESVQAPSLIVFYDSPNDPIYQSGSEWNLNVENATAAWDITHGKSDIKIGIIDAGTQQNHEDLINKIVGGDGVSGQHGTWVASAAAASTGNGLGVASLGWNISLVTYGWDSNGSSTSIVNDITSARAVPVDIINMSWGIFRPMVLSDVLATCPHPEKWAPGFGNIVPTDDSDIRQAVSDAIAQGIVCIAAAGNSVTNSGPSQALCDCWTLPWTSYPAAYPNVIAITGTYLSSGVEYFNTGWNYGSFVSCSAPGRTIPVADYSTSSTTQYISVDGTSFSSPQVCALVGLIKSLGSFSKQQIMNIIQNSSDKVDNSNYPYTSGWNQYLGYGRINAYKALKYTIEHYGGTLTQNLTIPSGETWTFQPGVMVTFTNGASLIVNNYGTLTANGTLAKPITFDFVSPNLNTYNGIKFIAPTSMGTINYCQIRNAYRGIYEYQTCVNITNSAISGCTDGIYLYQSYPTIQGCNIHNNSNAGINMLYSSSSNVIKENYIQNNGTGIYCSSSSQPVIGNKSTRVGNYISSNSYGVIVFNNALPVIGNGSSGGYNNFINSTNNILNTTGNTVYALKNWWNNDPKIGGSVLYLPDTTQITINTPPLSKATGSFLASANEEIPMLSELDKAYELVASNNLADARTVCLNLVNNYPDLSVSYNALNLLKETYSEKDLTSKKDIYESVFNKKNKKDLYAMAGLILSDIDKENRLKHLDNVIDSYKGESVIELALFDKLVYYYFELNDVKSARAISDELDKQFPESMGSIEAHKILGDEKYFGIHPEYQALNKTTASTTPKVYTLYDNYPNPFNPTTTINFQLPKDGYVTLKVYDVLGREVASLVNEDKKAGYYSYNFDASKLSSGVYIYKITANDFVQSKKMLLMK